MEETDPIAPHDYPITGEVVARAALADFATFFLPGQSLPIELVIENVSGHARAGGKTIKISQDMAAQVIDDADRLHFHLIILGHEIAHVIHKHAYSGPIDAEDDAALEHWADFYGAKVMMTLLSFGPQTRAICSRFIPDTEAAADVRLPSIGAALGMLMNENIYVENAHYPPPLKRVALAVIGIVAFLRLYIGVKRPTLFWEVFNQTFMAPSLYEFRVLFAEQVNCDPEPIERIRRWHKARQGDNLAIGPDFAPRYVFFLHTTFAQTDDEIIESRRERLAEVQAAGYFTNIGIDGMSFTGLETM
jgi:hypothetical protein